MHNKEALEMMYRCKDEFESLRRHIAQLEPKAVAFDLINKVMSYVPDRNSQGYGEDIVWVLKRRINEIEAQEKEPLPPDNHQDGREQV